MKMIVQTSCTGSFPRKKTLMSSLLSYLIKECFMSRKKCNVLKYSGQEKKRNLLSKQVSAFIVYQRLKTYNVYNTHQWRYLTKVHPITFFNIKINIWSTKPFVRDPTRQSRTKKKTVMVRQKFSITIFFWTNQF